PAASWTGCSGELRVESLMGVILSVLVGGVGHGALEHFRGMFQPPKSVNVAPAASWTGCSGELRVESLMGVILSVLVGGVGHGA
ncbi:hypothetical protein D9B85_15280, partial [Corynebacterium diphtheriae]